MTTPHQRALEAATKAWMDDRGIDATVDHRRDHWRESISIAISAYLEAIGGVVCAKEPFAYACSQRLNHLWSAAQFNNALPKNRTDCDIPLHAHIAGKGDDDEAPLTISYPVHQIAHNLLMAHTGSEGGCPRIDWYKLRAEISDAIEVALDKQRQIHSLPSTPGKCGDGWNEETKNKMLRLAVAAVLEADKEFRDNLPPDWEGDHLSDELDGLRRVFQQVSPPPPSSQEGSEG